jgi:DNA polymerase-3 subunit chi
MTDISFYHLLTTPLEAALPRLMEKALKSGQRSLVRVDSESRMDRLNDMLWSYDDRGFLPHGSYKDAFPEQQPIYLTTRDENPNQAAILVITDGGAAPTPERYSKILDMFDGHDDAQLQAARGRWKEYKAAGHEIRYFQQQKDGGWKQMA